MERFSIDKALEREILLSEKLRAKLLASIFFYAIIVLFLLRIFFSDFIVLFLPNLDLMYYFQAVLLFFVMREAVLIRILTKRLDEGKGVRTIFRYITNFIEISYPTIAMIAIGFYFNSIDVLFAPVVYFYFLVLILSTLSLEFKISLFAGIIAAIEYLILFYVYKDDSGVLENNLLANELLHFGKAALLILGGVIAGFVANQIKRKINNINKAQQERNTIIDMFGQQVSSSVVDELLNNNNQIESKEKYACIMFLDIRDFTRFAENKKPEDIIDYQNKVFGFMIEIIKKHHGIINQFVGDGYMATFGLPLSTGNDCQNAVDAAIEIIDTLNEKNERKEIPSTKIGIGLHSGLVVAGNVGTDQRKQYSISGNTVITASRIEQLNKVYTSQLLISKEVLSKMNTDIPEPELKGDVQLKGRKAPIEIWQLK